MTEHKRCADCGCNKTLDQFRLRNTRGRTGHLPYCVDCLRLRGRESLRDALKADQVQALAGDWDAMQ